MSINDRIFHRIGHLTGKELGMNIEFGKPELEVRTDCLREALYHHAEQVRDYFASSLLRIEEYSGERRRVQITEFLSRAGLLAAQLDMLVRSSRRVAALRQSLNIEQLEALVASLYRQVQEVSRRPEYGDELFPGSYR